MVIAIGQVPSKLMMKSAMLCSSTAPAITENEKLLLKSKNYAAIIKAQKKYDEQIDKQVRYLANMKCNSYFQC